MNKDAALILLELLFIALIVLIPILTIRKQKERGPKLKFGEPTKLIGAKELNVQIAFSQCKIMGLSEEDFLRYQCSRSKMGDRWREYWRVACNKQFLCNFCTNANYYTQSIGLKLGEFPDAQFTALFHVQIVNEDGTTSGLMQIIDNSSGETIAFLERFFGVGGRVGSLENLIGDAIKRLGTKFGKYLYSKLK